MAEPRLEELSAYLDHELTGAARQAIEVHLQACETCRRRLEALTRTVTAIHELPVEAPSRAFTIPAQREQPRRLAPVFGWVGGATAAALLVVIVAVSLGHLPRGGASATSAGLALSQGGATQQYRGTAPGAAAMPNDQAFKAAGPFPHQAPAVADPSNPARRIRLGSDAASYAGEGTITLQVILDGAPTATTDSAAAGLQLSLQRGGVGTALAAPVGLKSSNGPPVYIGTYRVSALRLPSGPGAYTLVATWTIPDGSGVLLVAQLPIDIRS